MKHLFFVDQRYSFAILRPLEQAALARGDQVRWFLYDMDAPDFLSPETVLKTTGAVMAYDPDSTIAPGPWLPHFFPGLKVQVFHGFGIEKTGHFRIRGLFDLFCTHGPLTTDRFLQLRELHPHFDVVETGWPKLDPWVEQKPKGIPKTGPTRVLYAPTFSPSLTSAPDLFEAWEAVAGNSGLSIKVKFHTLEKPEIVARYQASSAAFLVCPQDDILPLIAGADILVSDTSSVVAEAICLGVPVLAYRSKQPGDHFRNFTDAAKLGTELGEMVREYDQERQRGRGFGRKMHPYSDGHSSERVLDAIQRAKSGSVPPKSKPRNLLRKYKITTKMRNHR